MMKFLVVDDNSIDRELMKKLLSGFGEVEVFSDGFELVKVYSELVSQQVKVDALFLDVQMPVLDGYDILKMVRTYEKINKTVPTKVAFVTGTDELSCLDEVPVEFSYDGFIEKPVTKKVFLEVLANMGVPVGDVT